MRSLTVQSLPLQLVFPGLAVKFESERNLVTANFNGCNKNSYAISHVAKQFYYFKNGKNRQMQKDTHGIVLSKEPLLKGKAQHKFPL